jgi:uncharacterized protein YaeQ
LTSKWRFLPDYCRLAAENCARAPVGRLQGFARAARSECYSRIAPIRRGFKHLEDPVTVKATIFKAQLQVNDMDRSYFHAHSLTLARHPLETDERLMVRLLAFAMHAQETLQFARGLAFDEPDLWRKDLTGAIDLWITVGQPDEPQMRRACGRARQVVVYTYSGRSAQAWWQKSAAAAARSKNLTVVDLSAEDTQALATLAKHGMQMQCFIQDGEIQMLGDTTTVPIGLTTRASAR